MLPFVPPPTTDGNLLIENIQTPNCQKNRSENYKALFIAGLVTSHLVAPTFSSDYGLVHN
jgi:nicotinamidase-related amidase